LIVFGERKIATCSPNERTSEITKASARARASERERARERESDRDIKRARARGRAKERERERERTRESEGGRTRYVLTGGLEVSRTPLEARKGRNLHVV